MKHNQEDIIGIPLYQPMPPEIWVYINKDPQEFMSDEELQAWHEVCKHQVLHHPDGKIRKLFKQHLRVNTLKRFVTEAAASLAIMPEA